METLNCIIIEDNLSAQRILKGYLDEIPNINLIGTYFSPIEALPVLEKEDVNVLFLDIHLPKISGIDFLKSLQNPPSVILTTAFTEYAVDGFELDVVDYLLKPFSFERFLKSISKIKRVFKNANPIIHQQHIFVRSKGVIQKIEIAKIGFIEAKGDFVLIHTSTQRFIANSTLNDILHRLGNNFVRSHKSYVVNINAIDKIDGNRINIGTQKISIGRTYREELLSRLKMI